MTATSTDLDLVFLDTETLGVDLMAPIWEVYAIRRDGVTAEETELYLQVTNDPTDWLDRLDEPFRTDYRTRFKPEMAVARIDAAFTVYEFTRDATIVGRVPNFDTERIEHQLLRPAFLPTPWHYALLDVGNMVVGYLAGRGELIAPPWTSDALSAAIGVNPDDYHRHTAIDDVQWVRDQYDAVTGVAKERDL
ncbi:MAG: exonuclease domain-containing protein [Actinomycetota bacterium]|nr:exonuclease domain-containing protein [Actinomycetota bacterium]